MRISLVVAVADNGVIGRAGSLPWYLPDDLKHFRALTIGKAVLMGRRTFESIGRPLTERYNLIMSHAAPPRADVGSTGQVQWVQSVAEAVARAQEHYGVDAELCVIGGGQIYAATLVHASRIYLTQVHATVDGDAYFPGYPLDGISAAPIRGWRETARVAHGPDARHAYGMSFVTLQRLDDPTGV